MTVQKHLLLDDALIARAEGVRLTVNRAARFPGNPVLGIDQPWEKDALFGFPTIMYDDEERIFKAWYSVFFYDLGVPRRIGGALAYATSQDGIHWVKPQLGLVEHEGTTDNNLLFPVLQSFHCRVLKDPSEVLPKRRYKMLFYFRTRETIWAGMFTPINVAYSGDGIHWHTPYRGTNPVIPAGTDALGLYWDARRRRYVALLRPEYNVPRIVCGSESDDFVHWTPRVPILAPDDRDPPHSREFYGMVVTPYAEYYLGLLDVYHTLHEGWTAWQPVTPDMPEGLETTDIQLVHSRDGQEWRRTADRTPLLPVGSADSWDAGMVHAAQAPLMVGDELWVYYNGYGERHYDAHRPGYRLEPERSGLGLATLPRDRFVEVAAAGEGVAETRFLRVIPEEVTINAQAHGGTIQVEVTTPFGRAIAGLSREQCDPFRGDALDHKITWQGVSRIGAIVPGLRGGVCLRFYLQHALLFALSLVTTS